MKQPKMRVLTITGQDLGEKDITQINFDKGEICSVKIDISDGIIMYLCKGGTFIDSYHNVLGTIVDE